uniref:Proteasome inhibitor PI31 subunit n=1 Tax=Anopheles epiroticus TaxID=199890 RepID=A0A182PQI3_9DIPT
MPPNRYFGLEMLWKLEKDNVTSKSDAIIVFVHWFLSNNGFRNVGVGDDVRTVMDSKNGPEKTQDNTIEQSELLPMGWNSNRTSYALRYTLSDELYILHATVMDETMILNLLQAKKLDVSNVAFNMDKIIGSITESNPLNVVINVDEQIARLETELVKPLQDGKAGSKTTQPPTSQGFAPAGPSGAYVNRLRDPPIRIGGADLDPRGRLGGGMLMDPMRGMGPAMPRFPGYIPGARIDPVNPFLGRPRPNPNPDHLPPPGYDDMFM